MVGYLTDDVDRPNEIDSWAMNDVFTALEHLCCEACPCLARDHLRLRFILLVTENEDKAESKAE